MNEYLKLDSPSWIHTVPQPSAAANLFLKARLKTNSIKMNFMCTISVFPLLSIGANLVEKKKSPSGCFTLKATLRFPGSVTLMGIRSSRKCWIYICNNLIHLWLSCTSGNGDDNVNEIKWRAVMLNCSLRRFLQRQSKAYSTTCNQNYITIDSKCTHFHSNLETGTELSSIFCKLSGSKL